MEWRRLRQVDLVLLLLFFHVLPWKCSSFLCSSSGFPQSWASPCLAYDDAKLRVQRRRDVDSIRRRLLLSQPSPSLRSSSLSRLSADSNNNQEKPEAHATTTPTRQLVRTLLGLGLVGTFYTLHLSVFSQHLCILGYRWVVGYDTLAGTAVLLGRMGWGLARKEHHRRPSCWNFAPHTSVTQRTSLLATLFLLLGYLSTGTLALQWDDWVYSWSLQGWPWLTLGVARALPVLLGHVTWTLLALGILTVVVRPYFWNAPSVSEDHEVPSAKTAVDDTSSTTTVTAKDQHNPTPPEGKRYHWISWRRNRNGLGWVAWTIGGYAVTATLFHLVDRLNQTLLLSSNTLAVWNTAPPSLVAELVAPEGRDRLALLLGAIAPCVTAPFLEEVLYRGFGLAALSHVFGNHVWLANLVQAFLFALHHRSVVGFLPLWALGWLWGRIYQRSQSLWTVVAIHALWNARVFVGSWWGLFV